ncbi:hypothetical protein OQJ13_00380 [Legionella sp. PATHC035]|uniref:hypothetical protein n=1 Tax=Legionella sp. PATHC035 TaxID=2992040 RepID=UPI00224313F3|nr:hypothetical protein [Legionella sp. PATHC035]MCW8407427.1 hypothetical protein [Legionella sp. PATHC035]
MPISSSSPKPTPMTLTSSQLEQWFANIERNQHPNTSEDDPYLATQFLSRFGLRNAKQVAEFLKTAGGNETINMIVQELVKEEAQLQLIRERNAEEQLKQQRLLFLLLTFIAKDKKLAKHVNEIIQQQIDQKLKETKTAEAQKVSYAALQIVDANIQAYSKAIKALEEEEQSLKEKLDEVEEELNALEEEALLMEETHVHMTDHLDELNVFLQAPIFNNQPITQFISYSNQQIASLSAQLAALKAQHAAQTSTLSDASRVQAIESPTDRKIRMLQNRLDFFQKQFVQPPQSSEQVVQQLIAQVRTRLEELQRSNELQIPMTLRERELEGLRLQERGFLQAQQFLRKEKILLNSQLEPVNDFTQAYLIIDPNEQARYRKHGNSYVILSEDRQPDGLTAEDWLQAKLNYERLKSDICCVNADYYERRQQQLDSLDQRRQPLLTKKNNFIDRLEEVKANKVEQLHALSSAKAQRALLSQPQEEITPLSMSPRPTPKTAPKLEPKCSYSLMMPSLKCLVPTLAPAHKVDLDERFNEVKPAQITEPELRLDWLYRAKNQMPDIPAPELDSELKYKK